MLSDAGAVEAGAAARDICDCPVCGAGEPHALDVEPELGPDPHWVCGDAGVKVAAVGSLGEAIGGSASS